MTPDPFTLFLDPSCPHCQEVRNFLLDAGVPFEERDVTTTRELIEDLVWISGGAIVPTLLTPTDVIVGFDTDRLEEAVQSWRDTAASMPSDLDA